MSCETPLLPVPNRLDSFWLSERDTELQHVRTTGEVPSQADAVIVGSGLSGAMLAYHLYTQAAADGRDLTVVMLEADEVCGSATARNGGHCKPLTCLGFRAQAAAFGAEVANQLMDFEQAALGQYAELVEKEDIDCDMHVTRAFDVCFVEKDAIEGRKDWDARSSEFPQSIKNWDVRSVDDPAELEALTGIRGGYWGVSYPAGHLWPYKLATALIRKCLGKGMNLQAHTPATSLSPGDKAGSWIVSTSRGDIRASTVLVATNAYTSSLLPEFKPLIIPVRGTACSITPAPSHSPGAVPGPIKYTYGLRHGVGDIDYMIPRQGRGRIPGRGDRSIILGGAKSCYLKDLDKWYDNKWDDQEIPGVTAYFEEYMKKYFVGWNGNKHGNVDKVWSGVLGYSSDMLPYIGQIPGRPGVFICAGFTGHGMPRIPGCTAALNTLVTSHLVNGSISSEAAAAFESAVPSPYWMTRERLESRVNTIKAAMGQGEETDKVAGTVGIADEGAMLAQAMDASL